MKKLLEYLVTSIVEHPEAVVIEESEEEGQLQELYVKAAWLDGSKIHRQRSRKRHRRCHQED